VGGTRLAERDCMRFKSLSAGLFISLSACVATPIEEADVPHASEEAAISVVDLEEDGGTPHDGGAHVAELSAPDMVVPFSSEMQLYEQLYSIGRAGCAQTGARIARFTSPLAEAPIEVECADLTGKDARGLIGALVGLAVTAVMYVAE
jgi:hypothetical protein